MKKLILLLALALLALPLSGCYMFAGQPEEVEIPNPVVTIEMADGKIMQAELYPKIAPNTVANIVTLIQKGFYDGLTFHRIVPGFVIQTGDPLGNGTGGPGYTIKGEFKDNGFENDLSHTRGVLSMARLPSDMDSAGSQFFIMHLAAEYLDGGYAAFGKLIGEESFTTLDVIASTPTDAAQRPLVEQAIKRVTVDTKGYQYEVVKLED